MASRCSTVLYTTCNIFNCGCMSAATAELMASVTQIDHLPEFLWSHLLSISKSAMRSSFSSIAIAWAVAA